MSIKKPIHPFTSRFLEFCDSEAERISSELIACCESGDTLNSLKFSEEDASVMAFVLSDELAHFFWNAISAHIKDPDGVKRLTRLSSKIAARRSATKRSAGSKKQRFIEFALEQNRRNPSLSKSAVAEMFARSNPGTSVTTLRRYLSVTPFKGVD